MSPVDPTLIDPVAINILIVADGRMRYDSPSGNPGDFSLSLMIEGLHQTAGPLVQFSTTTAYRIARERIRKCDQSVPYEDGVSDPDCDSLGQGSEIGDFRFDGRIKVEVFDEIWIFGDQAEALNEANQPKVTTTQLLQPELDVLQRFMDQGGGVLATGDHLSLGASINAYVPRARAMRFWRNGPDIIEPTVKNTQARTPGNPAGSELDSTPQEIIPVPYHGHLHPVLDGPSGAIHILPDHNHEGECRSKIELSDLGDFPGGAPLPLVVSNSHRNGRPASDVFPGISAYDGHLASVGRVLVDASFHHFVNMNLRPNDQALCCRLC